ncbi:hypothetical protein GUJ93_ZPchr0013g37233 [Zizania palustris]|uniref:Uncharacterized protein n=1 Tax=Zizania palustris TaxID=103762 RepID=A0A8J6C1B2_ZIZPA|nr:hypothetical protein GUJ93_ZPchr0013g37233 [Zizania palustris]
MGTTTATATHRVLHLLLCTAPLPPLLDLVALAWWLHAHFRAPLPLGLHALLLACLASHEFLSMSGNQLIGLIPEWSSPSLRCWICTCLTSDFNPPESQEELFFRFSPHSAVSGLDSPISSPDKDVPQKLAFAWMMQPLLRNKLPHGRVSIATTSISGSDSNQETKCPPRLQNGDGLYAESSVPPNEEDGDPPTPGRPL